MDQKHFVERFLQNQIPLKGYLLAATGNVHDADDLFQAVWTVLWENSAQYDPSRPFRAWALGVARLEVLKWRQRLARRREMLSLEAFEKLTEAAEEAMSDAETWRFQIRRCVERLGDKAQEIVRLRYQKALSIKEIERLLGKNISTIKMVLVRSRQALRECLERKSEVIS